MENTQAKKPNSLVETTRAAGHAVRAGNMDQLRDLAKALTKAGGTISQDSRETLGQKPSQLPHLTKKAGNQNDANHRAITHDRPPPGHGR